MQQNRIDNAPLLRYVEAYRQHGHKRARLDPLGLTPIPAVPELDSTFYGLHPDADYDVSGIVDLPFATTHATGEQLQRHLERTYCSSIAAEFTHLHSAAQRDFLASRLESITPTASLSPADRRNIHSLLLQSATFDRFMAIKFPSTKRYGLEGAEALLPAIDAVFASASQQGVQQTVVGMPHRGRLNLMVALLDFPARALFSKVQGKSWVPAGMRGDCDVLSHASTTVTKKFDHHHNLTVSLLPNPSHLEAINPVAQGRVRAEQQLLATRSPALSADEQRRAVMCVQIHGDAAFSGQGVVAEALTLANLPDFTVGGTVHITCNNQIGFTAGREKGRSSLYSSDMAKIINSPVLHVNADNVEAVVYASKLAVDYRNTFHEDIIVDIVGYRRLGHNEVDEPRFTQPAMYKQISDRRSVVDVYGEELERLGLLKKETSERLVARLMSHLEAELAESKSYAPSADAYFLKEWAGYRQADHCYDHVNTGVDVAVLKEVALASVALPPSFHIHPRLLRSHVESRRKAVSATSATIDWATAEAMATGTLLRDGYDVRMSGQDVERGTFSHRHAVLYDQNTNAAHTPFHHANYPGHAQFVSSNLSECGVLGFEYGYNLTSPHTLNVWEAQYGYRSPQYTHKPWVMHVTHAMRSAADVCGVLWSLSHVQSHCAPHTVLLLLLVAVHAQVVVHFPLEVGRVALHLLPLPLLRCATRPLLLVVAGRLQCCCCCRCRRCRRCRRLLLHLPHLHPNGRVRPSRPVVALVRFHESVESAADGRRALTTYWGQPFARMRESVLLHQPHQLGRLAWQPDTLAVAGALRPAMGRLERCGHELQPRALHTRYHRRRVELSVAAVTRR